MTSGFAHYPTKAQVFVSAPNPNGDFKFELARQVPQQGQKPIYRIAEVSTSKIGLVGYSSGTAYVDPNDHNPDQTWFIASWVNIGIPNETGTYDWVSFQLDDYGTFTATPHALLIEGKSHVDWPEDPDIRWTGSEYPDTFCYKEMMVHGIRIRIERVDNDSDGSLLNIYVNSHELR